MNESNTALIGTPVNVTVFVVDYQYTKPARKQKLPKTAKQDLDKVQNRVIVTSGDPTGQDVFYITKRLVLGANPYEGSDFRVLNQQRMVDAMGLATTTSWAKLDGQAPEEVGVEVKSDEGDPEQGGEDSDQGEDGGSTPPVSNLN